MLTETAKIRVEGGHRFNGETYIQGAKNAVLPCISASLLATEGETVLYNVPNITDVVVSLKILEDLGAKVEHDIKAKTVWIDATNVTNYELHSDLSDKVRASILFLGPLLGRLKRAELNAIGGCRIGERRIDFHHRGFARLGATVTGNYETELKAYADKLVGTYLYLDTPSHTGTENLLMAACLAEGETIIDNASSEPELENLADMLCKMGAKISGIGTRRLIVQGVTKLRGVKHTIIPDRHDSAGFAIAVGLAGGKATLRNYIKQDQMIVEAKLQQMGLHFTHYNDDVVTIEAPDTVLPVNIITNPYPGFSTDAQQIMGALATIADGRSYIRETIYEGRYDYVNPLVAMGAEMIVSKSGVLIIDGVKQLKGAAVTAPDLRGGVALMAAGFAADGVTEISNAHLVFRGCEEAIERFSALGAVLSVMS